MLDEFGSEEAQDYIGGFPPHPHRGFQTLTYMLNGKMGHNDSVGNEGTIEDGGLQWMNAGKGIIHEEMPKQTHGKMRGFELWVNLPAAQKMSEPGYDDIKSEAIV
jgi:redox-sensitive bicupin YhaK (pirin superfamily)